MKEKKRKEFTKLNSVLKIVLKKMYKKYGYNQSLTLIENMKEPTFNERTLMLNYINELEAERKKDESTIANKKRAEAKKTKKI